MQGKKKLNDYLTLAKRSFIYNTFSLFKKKRPGSVSQLSTEPTNSVKYNKYWLMKNKAIEKQEGERIAAAGELYRLFLGNNNSPKIRCIYDEVLDQYFVLQEKIERFKTGLFACDYPPQTTLPNYAAVALTSGFLGEVDANHSNFGLENNQRVKRCDLDMSLNYAALCMPINKQHLLNLNHAPYSFPFIISEDAEDYLCLCWDFEDVFADSNEKMAALYTIITTPITAIAAALFKHISDPDQAFHLLFMLEMRQQQYKEIACSYTEFNAYWHTRHAALVDQTSNPSTIAVANENLLTQYGTWKAGNEKDILREISAINAIANFNQSFQSAFIDIDVQARVENNFLANETHDHLTEMLNFLFNDVNSPDQEALAYNNQIRSALHTLDTQLNTDDTVEAMFATFYQLLESNEQLAFFAQLFFIKELVAQEENVWSRSTLQMACFDALTGDSENWIEIFNAYLATLPKNDATHTESLVMVNESDRYKSPYKELIKNIDWIKELYKQQLVQPHSSLTI